jgi:aminoglycoside 6'-N-acetyltransferase
MVIRPLAERDAAELRRIHSLPEVARWWGQPPEGFPLHDDPETTRQAIEVDGQLAGLIDFWEEQTPRYRHATIDLFLDPAFHGRGLGSEAVRRVARELIEQRGHTASRSTPRRATLPRFALTKRPASSRPA